MRPRPTYFSDLIEFAKISHTRFDEAFGTGCPTIARWCTGPDGTLTSRQARDDVLGQLRVAFNKGLVELAQARTGRFGWGSSGVHLTFAWSPYFDVLEMGKEMFVLRVDGVARATPVGAPLRRPAIEAGALNLVFNEWRCDVSLSIGEGRIGTSTPFYEAEGTVYLPSSFEALGPAR